MPRTQTRFSPLAIWLAIFLTVFLVYAPALKTFFSQDDFVHLLLGRISSLREFLFFFVPAKGAIFYRPLSVQVYSFLGQGLFGLNPLGFHLVALGFHLANTYLVYKLLYYFLKRKNVSLLAALLYGVHPSHFMSLFWMAEFSTVLGPFFAFLSLLSFLRGNYWQFWLFTLLGLLSSELTIAVPLILGLWLLVTKGFQKKWRFLIPALLGVGGVLLLRFIVFPTSLGTEYVLSFSPQTVFANLRWQLFRAVGLPEGFLGQWGLWQTRLAVGALSFALGFSVFALRPYSLKNLRLFWFGLGWFVLGLLPVLFLLRHQSPIYQIIGLPGLMVAFLSLLPEKRLREVVLYAIAGFFIIATFWAIRAQDQYHWVTRRARLARYHLEKLEQHQPHAGTPIVFLNTVPESSRSVYLSLAGDYGLRALFDPQVKVIFEDFAGQIFPQGAIYVLSRTDGFPPRLGEAGE